MYDLKRRIKMVACLTIVTIRLDQAEALVHSGEEELHPNQLIWDGRDKNTLQIQKITHKITMKKE